MFFKNLKWALLWAVLIFILCAIPGKDIPFGGIWDVFNLDKFIHASLFFVQVILLVQGFKKQNAIILFARNPKLYAVAICIMYGGDLELMQGAFFQDRTADIFDFIANSIGAIAGALLFEKVVLQINTWFKK